MICLQKNRRGSSRVYGVTDGRFGDSMQCKKDWPDWLDPKLRRNLLSHYLKASYKHRRTRYVLF